MKILWLVNVPMPKAASAMGFAQVNSGGWLSGQLDMLAREDTEMVVCHVTKLVKAQKRCKVDGVAYIFMPAATKNLTEDFAVLLQGETPDVIHIFGTEYAHSEAMMQACAGKHCVVSLQGIMTEYAKRYKDGLPQGEFDQVAPVKKLVNRFYYAESIAQGEQTFFARGRCEAKMLLQARHVIGRTHWDKACAEQLCPQAAYHSVNENLRAEFYDGDRWTVEKCRRHSIFVSQALYPIKGFHQLLKAMPKLVANYPDLHVFVGGVKPYTLHNKLLDLGVDYFFEYQHFVKKMIREKGLSGYITYTGPLDAAGMKAQYLNCNVFVSPSAIENSPNSVGEAMLLGTPIAASNVGGVASMLTDETDGLLYDFYDVDALAERVDRIFRDDALCYALSQNAQQHAAKTHDRAANTAALMGVYDKIAVEK